MAENHIVALLALAGIFSSCCSFGLTPSTSVPPSPGLIIKFTDGGVEFLERMAEESFKRRFPAAVALPDVVVAAGQAHGYNLTNVVACVNVTSLSGAKLQSPTEFSWTENKIAISAVGRYSQWSNEDTRSGTLTVHSSDSQKLPAATISITADESGDLNFALHNCSAAIDPSLKISFSNGSLPDNDAFDFSLFIAADVQRMLASHLCNSFRKILNESLNEFLQVTQHPMKSLPQYNATVHLNNSLVAAPIIRQDAIELKLKGSFHADDIDPQFQGPRFLEQPAYPNRDVTIQISEHFFNTLGYTLQQTGIIRHAFNAAIQQHLDATGYLNLTCCGNETTCMGAHFPATLTEKYPNLQSLKVEIPRLSAPQFFISSPNGFRFDMVIPLEISAKPSMHKDRISLMSVSMKLAAAMVDLKITRDSRFRATLGRLISICVRTSSPVNELRHLNCAEWSKIWQESFRTIAEEFLTNATSIGIPIPIIGSYNLEDPTIRIVDHSLLISTNLSTTSSLDSRNAIAMLNISKPRESARHRRAAKKHKSSSSSESSESKETFKSHATDRTCDGLPDGYFPEPNASGRAGCSQKYFSCVHGRRHDFACGQRMVFDNVGKRCVKKCTSSKKTTC